MRKLALLFSIALAAAAQPVIAPTNAPVGTPRGQDAGDYNVVHSFETGYRFHTVGGNEGKYRSDVNFGNGVRLLGSNLAVHSREGHGKYFDELLIGTLGLGNDPYQSASARIAKNKLYRYDLLWRLNDYYNPALPLAAGQHFMDTTRTMQDHSLVLLPQSPIRLLTGFSRVNQNGPALSTLNWPDLRGDEFALFTNVRRLQNEFRLGTELDVAGWKLTLVRAWESFRDDTRRTSDLNRGAEPGDNTLLNSFRRDEPYHGETTSWRAGLVWDRAKWAGLRARFVSVDGRRNFVFDEAAFGLDRLSSARNRQVLVTGDARRPVTSGSLTLTVMPGQRITVTNHTAFHNTRIDGDSNYREIDNNTLLTSLLNFQLLGIRTITNATDFNVRAARVLGFFAGYQFSDRRIRSVEQTEFEGFPDRISAEQSNRLHAGRFGVRIQPLKPVSILLDTEIGRADRPIYPTSERNYHALGGRIQYKTRALFLSAMARTNYNTNSASLLSHSSRTRNYAADASWTARTWLSFDANYSKIHLDTLTGLAYFFNRSLVGDTSVYISNVHSGTLGVRFVAGRAEVFGGYTRVQDTGDGRTPRGAAPFVPGVAPASLGPGLLAYQVYPLSYESPMARLSIRLHTKIRWNAGYQHYRYAEELLPLQNYRAHTGFTSVTWSF